MTILDHVTDARAQLAAAGIPDAIARLDADLLARHALDWDRATFIARSREPAPDGFNARFPPLVARRAGREPIHYILGVREFWGRMFEVSPDVLIPRPETELIVEEALRRYPTGHAVAIVDMGTGSGCLGVTLAAERREATVVATDISHAALGVARRNAARHGVGRRLTFVQASFLSALRPPFDLIVSNPPYVAEGAAPALSPEVRDHEPPAALYAGPDGLASLAPVMDGAVRLLRPGGRLIMELGLGHEPAVTTAVAARPALAIEAFSRDLQDIARVAIIVRPLSSHK